MQATELLSTSLLPTTFRSSTSEKPCLYLNANAADGIRTRNVSVVVNFKFTVSRQLHHCDRNMGSGGATHKCLVKLRDCAKRNDLYFVANLNNGFTRTIKVELHFGTPFISQPYLYSISYFLGLFKFFLFGTSEVFLLPLSTLHTYYTIFFKNFQVLALYIISQLYNQNLCLILFDYLYSPKKQVALDNITCKHKRILAL